MTRPREGLAAFIVGGGAGSLALNVEIGAGVERLVVDTPSGAVSRSAALLDWLTVDAGPLLQQARIVPIETSTGAVGSASAVASEYLANGAASSAASDPTFRVGQLTPKHIGTLPIAITQNALAVMPNAEQWLQGAVRAALRRKIIEAALIGTGADGQPRGIINTPDVVTIAAPGALTALDFAKLEALKGAVAAAEVEDRPGDLFVLSTAVARQAAQTLAETRAARRLLERRPNTPAGDVYEEVPGLGRAYRTNDLSGNRAVFGDFRELGIGVWTGDGVGPEAMFVIVDPVSAKPNIEITGYAAIDVAVLQPARFALATYT